MKKKPVKIKRATAARKKPKIKKNQQKSTKNDIKKKSRDGDDGGAVFVTIFVVVVVGFFRRPRDVDDGVACRRSSFVGVDGDGNGGDSRFYAGDLVAVVVIFVVVVVARVSAGRTARAAVRQGP